MGLHSRDNPIRFGYFLVTVIAVIVVYIVWLPTDNLTDPVIAKIELMLTLTIMVFAIVEGFSTYLQVVDNRMFLRFENLKNEIENCYGPIYHTLLNTHFSDAIDQAEDGNPTVDVHYEAGEREKLNNIFENYSYLISLDVYHDWKEYSNTRGADDGGIDLPFGYVERLMIEHETRVTDYRELVRK